MKVRTRTRARQREEEEKKRKEYDSKVLQKSHGDIVIREEKNVFVFLIHVTVQSMKYLEKIPSTQEYRQNSSIK